MTQTAEDQRGVQTQILDQHLHPVTAEQLLPVYVSLTEHRQQEQTVRLDLQSHSVLVLRPPQEPAQHTWTQSRCESVCAAGGAGGH